MHKSPNGVLVLTKLIDENFITNIEDNLLFTIAALQPHQIDKELVDTSVVDIFRIKKFPDSISVYVPVFDAFGDVALGLKLNIKRTVMQFGKRIFSNSLLLFIALSAVLVIAFMWTADSTCKCNTLKVE